MTRPGKPPRHDHQDPFIFVTAQERRDVLLARAEDLDRYKVSPRKKLLVLSSKVQRLPNDVQLNPSVLPVLRQLFWRGRRLQFRQHIAALEEIDLLAIVRVDEPQVPEF